MMSFLRVKDLLEVELAMDIREEFGDVVKVI